MEQTTVTNNSCDRKYKRGVRGGDSSGALYFFGILGAAWFYLQNSPTFWAGVIAVLKALVWPVFLVHQALIFLNA